jgi:hypothetical protein
MLMFCAASYCHLRRYDVCWRLALALLTMQSTFLRLVRAACAVAAPCTATFCKKIVHSVNSHDCPCCYLCHTLHTSPFRPANHRRLLTSPSLSSELPCPLLKRRMPNALFVQWLHTFGTRLVVRCYRVVIALAVSYETQRERCFSRLL